MGPLKGVGRIYQQTFIDISSKVGFAKRYDRKTPVTAAELLNDRVLPCFEQHDIPLSLVLTDRGTMPLGCSTVHEYELRREYRSHPDEDAASPDQRDLRAIPQDHVERVLSRRVSEEDLSDTTSSDRIRWWYGKTPMHTFVDSVPLAKEKILAA